MSIYVRNASIWDLDAILKVEESWPEGGRASAEKFISRINKFAEGFFLICKRDANNQEKVVATVTSMPLFYDPNEVKAFTNWDAVTNQGMLFDCDYKGKNALYIVSGVIDKEHRGENIFEIGVMSAVKKAQEKGLRYTIAGAVIPGYRKHCEIKGNQPAWEYCQTRKASKLIDPLLSMYEKIHFHVPHSSHVITEYYPDDASRNYAALVVRDLNAHPAMG